MRIIMKKIKMFGYKSKGSIKSAYRAICDAAYVSWKPGNEYFEISNKMTELDPYDITCGEHIEIVPCEDITRELFDECLSISTADVREYIGFFFRIHNRKGETNENEILTKYEELNSAFVDVMR